VSDSGGSSASATVGLTVEVPPVPAPDSVAVVSFVAASDSSVTLGWTEVDDGTGPPADYEIRIAPWPTDPAGGSAVSDGSCTEPVSGASVGATLECEATGLRMGTRYNAVITAVRLVSGGAAVSGAPSAVVSTFTDFVEDFTAFADDEAPTTPDSTYV
jgi:hypothetical protein